MIPDAQMIINTLLMKVENASNHAKELKSLNMLSEINA
jgi:hypothetical protein